MKRISGALALMLLFPALAATRRTASLTWPASSHAQLATRSAEARHTVEFDVRTGLTGLGGSSYDLILILFSNRSADTPLVATPLLGEDVVAEFAFSGRDALPGKPLVFRRRMEGVSFLDARFIQVINHGTDGWAGESLSMTVDGKPVLKGVALYPRKGIQERGGLEKFNRVDWRDRNFWEADLQRIRVDKR